MWDGDEALSEDGAIDEVEWLVVDGYVLGRGGEGVEELEEE